MYKNYWGLLIIFLSACSILQSKDPPTQYESGQIIEVLDAYGTFFVYAPNPSPKSPEILVLIHGTPAETETPEETAYYYTYNWRNFAERQGYILVVPAFNQADFSSRHGEITDSLTGYRGLFGRKIDADEWVLRLVAAYREE